MLHQLESFLQDYSLAAGYHYFLVPRLDLHYSFQLLQGCLRSVEFEAHYRLAVEIGPKEVADLRLGPRQSDKYMIRIRLFGEELFCKVKIVELSEVGLAGE